MASETAASTLARVVEAIVKKSDVGETDNDFLLDMVDMFLGPDMIESAASKIVEEVQKVNPEISLEVTEDFDAIPEVFVIRGASGYFIRKEKENKDYVRIASGDPFVAFTPVSQKKSQEDTAAPQESEDK